MNTEAPSYYMLRVEGRGVPTAVHEDIEIAMQEAERLSAKESKPVDLLMAVVRCSPIPKPETTESLLKRLALSTDTGEVIKDAMLRVAHLQELVDAAYDIMRLKEPEKESLSITEALELIASFREGAKDFITKA